MLTKRIISVLLLQGGRCVKTKQFANPRDVGDPVRQAKIMYDNGADEIVVLNIEPGTGIQPLVDILPRMMDEVFIPVAAGGGIRSVDDAAAVIAAGAEKVVIRTAVDIIPELAKRFGSQSVVQCIDMKDAAAAAVGISRGAGEIILQFQHRDGMMNGYQPVALIPLAETWQKPTVMLGGCGNYSHMLEAFTLGADACAAGSLWAFTDSNPIRAKRWLANHGVKVRPT